MDFARETVSILLIVLTLFLIVGLYLKFKAFRSEKISEKSNPDVTLLIVFIVLAISYLLYEKDDDGVGLVTDPTSYTYEAQQVDLLEQQVTLLKQQNALLNELVKEEK